MPKQELLRQDQIHDNNSTTKFYKSYQEGKRAHRMDENESGVSHTGLDKGMESEEFKNKPSFTQSRFNQDALDKAKFNTSDHMTQRGWLLHDRDSKEPERVLNSNQKQNLSQSGSTNSQQQSQSQLDNKDQDRFEYVIYKVDQSLGQHRQDYEEDESNMRQVQQSQSQDSKKKTKSNLFTQNQGQSTNEQDFKNTEYQYIDQRSESHDQNFKNPRKEESGYREQTKDLIDHDTHKTSSDSRKNIELKKEEYRKKDNNNQRKGDPQHPAKTHRKILSEENEALIHQGMPVDFPRKR
eukprot:403348802